MPTLSLFKPCPKCKNINAIKIDKSLIHCSQCDFKTQFGCPLCNEELNESDFHIDQNGEYFKCPGCSQQIHNKRIQYIIENAMHISHDIPCRICHGPTLHKKEANLGNRCFFFPKCSGQSTLFGEEKETLVFLDFETTGLEAGKDHIIEIGCLKIDEEGFEHTFQSFINPKVPIPTKITKITGITDEMVGNAPNLESVLDSFFKFIGSAKIVAHNADFDLPWLMVAAIKNNFKLKKNDIICTLKWAKKNGENTVGLEALSRKYKLGQQNAHRALADAAVTKELYFIFDHMQKSERPETPCGYYEDIATKLIERYEKVIG